MRISDWSSDVCSSDLSHSPASSASAAAIASVWKADPPVRLLSVILGWMPKYSGTLSPEIRSNGMPVKAPSTSAGVSPTFASAALRSEEHTSELQSLIRISYAVFSLHKKQHRRLRQKRLRY